MEANEVIAEGVPPEEGRFCADCKWLLGVRHRLDTVDNWNCGHPENTMWEKPSLITGIKKRISIRSLSILRYPTPDMTAGVRAEICSSEGKWYEKYEQPQREPMIHIQTSGKDTEAPAYTPATMKPDALRALTSKKKKIGMDDL